MCFIWQNWYGSAMDELRNGCDVNEAAMYGTTALILAAGRGYLNYVELLVIKYEANMELEDENLMTPLMHACNHYIYKEHNVSWRFDVQDRKQIMHCSSPEFRLSEKEKVALFLLDKDCQVNSKYEGGLRPTPLGLAVQSGMIKVVNELLKRNAIMEIHDKRGYTPLMMAVMNDDKNIVKALLSHGCSLSLTSTILKDNSTYVEVYVEVRPDMAKVFARYYAHMWRLAGGGKFLSCDIGKCIGKCMTDQFENLFVRPMDLKDLTDNNYTRLDQEKCYIQELRAHGISTVDAFMLSDFSWVPPKARNRREYYEEIQDKHRTRIVRTGPTIIEYDDESDIYQYAERIAVPWL
jgi:hypothetical protein